MCDKRGRKAWQRIPKQNLCRWCKSGICPPLQFVYVLNTAQEMCQNGNVRTSGASPWFL